MPSIWSYRPERLKLCPKLQVSFACVTLKFVRWPWKTIGIILYTPSCYVCNFIAISEFQMELSSGNAPNTLKSETKKVVFRARVTLKFDRWPWKTIGILFDIPWHYVCHFIAICEFHLELSSGNGPETLKFGENRRFLVLCDLEIWQMTLKNNRDPLLYAFMLCV